jgi:hypothetical protein
MLKILTFLFSMTVLVNSSFAYIKCAPSQDGAVCCWDTYVDGPFGPPGC